MRARALPSRSIRRTTVSWPSFRGSMPATRVFDIRNPFDVREIGYFIPAVNKEHHVVLRGRHQPPGRRSEDHARVHEGHPDEQRGD